MTGRYRIYGSLDSRETVALAGILKAKGLAAELVDETPSLALALAARSGQARGPYLRTPEGFVLGDLHAILDWIERTHATPALLPESAVRRCCARLVEDWISFWLPLWPRRSWHTLERLGAHIASAGFLLGPAPTRPDWLLAAWLETEVLVAPQARAHLSRFAPRLLHYGDALLTAEASACADDATPMRAGVSACADDATPMRAGVSACADDAIPITLLGVLEEVGRDFHAYLEANQDALKDREESVWLDLGSGRRGFPTRPACEVRRLDLAAELTTLGRDERLALRRVLEPVGAWHALTLPSVLAPIDPADPRSL